MCTVLLRRCVYGLLIVRAANGVTPPNETLLVLVRICARPSLASFLTSVQFDVTQHKVDGAQNEIMYVRRGGWPVPRWIVRISSMYGTVWFEEI